VPPDTRAPTVRARLPRSLSARALLDHRLPLRLRSSESGQVTVSLRIRGRSTGFGFATRDTPGRFRFTNFGVTRQEIRRLRSGIGGRAQLVINVRDHKENRVRLVRTVRLIR